MVDLGKVKAVVQKGCGMCKKMMRSEKRLEAHSRRAMEGIYNVLNRRLRRFDLRFGERT